MCTHLQKRGNRYFLRRAIPLDLREHYGRREITKALGTSDRGTAAVLCRRLGLELDEEFRQARLQGTLQGAQPIIRLAPAPAQPLAVATQPAAAMPSAAVVTLSDLADKWEAERKPDWRSKAVTRRVIRRFTSMVGDILPCDITRANAVDFKDKLLASGQTGVNTNKQLTIFNVLLNFGVANGKLENNPARGVNVVVKRNAKDSRHPFALRDLQAIFSMPVYTTGEAPDHIGHDAAYWIPLLALFYGARREELCQLRPEDVYEEVYSDVAGADRRVWVLRITDEGVGQKVKNANSVRRVPVHDELIARGFLKFAKAQQGQPRLFSDLRLDSKGEEGSAFGKWFNGSLRTVCGITDPKLVFHSFRHSFKDQCRALEIPEEVSDALSGHSSGKVSRRYGGLAFPLRPLVDAVQKYRVPGLVLPPILET